MSYNLQKSDPALAAEWHPEKNRPLAPDDVTPFSNKKVWWVCPKGHEWKAYISNRSRGSSCPFCAGTMVSIENSLQTVNPKLVKEWHPTKNFELTAKDVSVGSNKKVWWICKYKHEWEATINSRNRGSGCPYCSGRLPTESTCLATVNPHLAKEWHLTKNGNLTPKGVTEKSNRKVWWVCNQKHEWEATIDSRSRGQGCPYCAGKRICIDNCLETINTKLAKEWHPTKNGNLTTKDVTANSNKKVWWICSRNHEWKTSIYHRNKGSKCPYCSGNKVCLDNCLKTNNPELAKEWHPTKNGVLTPNDLTPKSTKKVWWICKRNHAWEATVKNRSNGSSCPFCNSATSELEIRIYSEMKYIFKNTKHRRKIFGLECDVYIPKLNLGFEIDGLYWHKDKFRKDIEKSKVFEKNNINLLRIREKGLKRTSPNDIFYSTGDSPLFIITKVLKKILKLPNVEDAAKNLTKKYLGLGKLQNESEFNRLIYMLPSPLPGNSLGDKNKILSKEWHNIKNKPLTPYDVYPNSFKKVWWICEMGQHEWRSRISDRFSKDAGCPYCAGKRVYADNCLQTLNPKLAKEWHPTKNGELTPEHVTANSNKKVWWICSRNHEWEATVDKRNIGRGCPYCARSERNKNRKLTIDEMQQIAKERGGKCLSIEYINIHTHLLWECANGHKWEAIPKSIKRGTWCPICARKNRR